MNRSIAFQEGDASALLAAQSILVALAAGAFALLGEPAQAQAALYGGAIALLSAWLLGRRVRRADQVARSAPGQETYVLYIGAVQRFILILVMFGAGMGALRLAPAPMLVGFAIAQVGFVVNSARVRLRAGRELERLG